MAANIEHFSSRADSSHSRDWPAVNNTREFFSLKYLAILTCIVLSAMVVNRIPIIPAAPSVFMPVLLFFLLFRDISASWPIISSIPTFRLFFLLSLVCAGGTLAERGFEYEGIASGARVISAFLLVWVISSYILNGGRLRIAATFMPFIFVMAASLLWFLAEISIVEPFVSLRTALYSDYYEGVLDWLGVSSESVRSGLAPFNHLLGFHFSFLAVFLLIFQSSQLKPWLKNLRVFLLITALIGIYFSAQRSALVSVLFSGALLLCYSGKFRQLMRFSLLLAAAVIFAGILISLSGVWEKESLQESLVIEKILDIRFWREGYFRLALQFKAVELAIIYPFGLAAVGENWTDLGFWPVYYSMEDAPYATPIAPHNGYLGVALSTGWVFSIPFLLAVFCVLRSFHASIRFYMSTNYSPFLLALLFTAPATLLVQSVTHNPSLFSQEPTCVIALTVLICAEAIRKSGKIHRHYTQSVDMHRPDYFPLNKSAFKPHL